MNKDGGRIIVTVKKLLNKTKQKTFRFCLNSPEIKQV